MLKYLLIFLVSCSKSIFKKNTPSSSSSSTTLIPIQCLNVAGANDVANAVAWDSFLENGSYLIFNANQILSLSGEVALINKKIELCANIDLQPLYDAGTPHFMLPGLDKDSIFNGNNFTLSNFTFVSTDPNLFSVALFQGGPANHPNFGLSAVAGINRGEIKNLIVDNILIQAQSHLIGGISAIQQMNPVTNVRILSGTLENTRPSSPDGGMIGGILAVLDVSPLLLTADNIIASDFIFEKNSTKIEIKYTNDGLALQDFAIGGLIGYLFTTHIPDTSSLSILLRNNFTNFNTFGNPNSAGLIGLLSTDACSPGVGEKCADVGIENSYSKAFHTVISSEIIPRSNYYAGIVGLLDPDIPVKLIVDNSFSALDFSTSGSTPSLTSLFDYTVHYSGAPGLTDVFVNNFGVTIAPTTPLITETYLTDPTEAESYFYNTINTPVSLWDTSIWDFTGSSLPTLIIQ